jgi:hypothetical protein
VSGLGFRARIDNLGWTIAVIIGLSPILTVWMAHLIGRFFRRKLRPRSERHTSVVVKLLEFDDPRFRALPPPTVVSLRRIEFATSGMW